MTTKRFKLRLSTLDNGMITDTQKREDLFFDKEFLDVTLPKATEWLNELAEENEQLKKELLFFYDVANCECSTNWKGDMEKGCKRFFNCTYEEAKEKYGDYDGMWWEIND